ncbi:hypothetical protein F2Q69_00004798 [Brassica cretica]|uniref:Uncharacterized protein n=1 Tax=Brassica cretica TaxID=69181 RepID=A0A8S9NZ38_BRACR|nr:hypothetical protein F2Q69_00004798 [Brassica cretica]
MTLATRCRAVDESLQRIGVLDNSVADQNRRFNDLDETFNRIAATSQINKDSLTATVKNAKSKIDRLESTINSTKTGR